MEPVFMVLGQSAAIAACLAMDKNYRSQELPYQELKEMLIKYAQVLE
jgi:hypothetical protein